MTASNEKIGKARADEGHRAGVTILDLRYDLEDKPAPIPSILFGLQHVLIKHGDDRFAPGDRSTSQSPA